ncbi:hypothetical protein RIF29_05655 [Crotalaria pallida]|uniref:Uncharacterized protein n=1 Tax=Crotalaria pallida TaxID=3830 RepID=A0AAN9J4W3_CROPI
MEAKETTSPPNPSLDSEGEDDFIPSNTVETKKLGSELDGRTQVIETAGHAPKQVHQFYFVKLWPTDPDSISQIKKEEKMVAKMNRDIIEITEKIKERMSERDLLHTRLRNLDYRYKEWRSRAAIKGRILNALYVALDELCFGNNLQKRISKKRCFMGDLDNHKLNSLMLHGSKTLAEEKKILRNIKTQQIEVASFMSLEVLKNMIKWTYYINHCQKLLREIELFQMQRERPVGDANGKGKISNCVSLKNAIKEQIKLFCDQTLENRRKEIAHETRNICTEKKIEAINKVIHSLGTKLAEKHQRKDEAYDSILKLKKLHDEEITHYYKYHSLMNKVHWLAQEKDVAALDELSRSEVGNFMLEWNNSEVFRKEYEKKVLQSLA